MPFKVAVMLRKNATGEVRTIDWCVLSDEHARQWFGGDGTLTEGVMRNMRYQWQDGNYSCDCNRIHVFHRAELFAGAMSREDVDLEGCTDTLYSLLGITVNGWPVELDEPIR